MIKKILVLIFIAFIGFLSTKSQSTPKYVFLFIGDGMGLNQVFLTEKYMDCYGNDSLIFLNPDWNFGLAKTECADSFRITDSGAAGTAIACGVKTSYGAIGVDKNNLSIESIAEYLKKKHFKIGILTSVPLNHATPASFFGHEPTRRNYDDLTKAATSSNFDFFAGGGFMFSNSDTSKNYFKSFDDILAKFNKNNYSLVLKTDGVDTMKSIKTPVVVIDTAIRMKQQRLKGVYSDERNSLPNTLDFPQNKDKLAQYTQAAINCLQNDSGFFVMVEGGKIDWACHDNDAASMVHEMISFNDAIKKAFTFYQKYPEQTLIIVTADHETGGMTIGRGFDESSKTTSYSYVVYPNKLALQKKSRLFSDSITVGNFNLKAQVGWTSNEHTGLPVGVWSIGPGSENFQGIYENSDLKKKILEAMKQ